MAVLRFPVFPEPPARTEYRYEKVGSPNLPNGPKAGVQSPSTVLFVWLKNARRRLSRSKIRLLAENPQAAVGAVEHMIHQTAPGHVRLALPITSNYRSIAGQIK